MSYNYFAEVYDDLTQNVDYDARSKYLASFLNDEGIKTGSDIIDLACGTGSIAVRLTDMGYRVTGIDLSPEMLSIADFKSAGKVSLINADMLNFSLRNTNLFDIIIHHDLKPHRLNKYLHYSFVLKQNHFWHNHIPKVSLHYHFL